MLFLLSSTGRAQEAKADVMPGKSNTSIIKIFNYKKDKITDSLYQLYLAAETKQNDAAQATLLYELGNHYLNQGNFTPAILSFEQSASYSNFEKKISSEQQLNTLINLANAYASNNQLDRAIEVSISGLAIANNDLEQQIADSMKIYLYINMSLVFIELNQDEKAQHYLDLAENIATQKKYLPFQVNILNSKGILADNKKNWQQSRAYYERVIHIADSLQHTEFKSIALGNLAISYFRSGEYEAAKTIFRQLTSDDSELPFHKRNEAFKMIGEILFKQKRYDEAIEYFKISLKNAISLNLSNDIIHAHTHFAKIYEAKGDFKTALYHSKANNKIIDSLSKTESLNKINQLEIQYRTKENEMKIRAHEFQIQKQKAALHSKNQMLLGGSISMLLIVFLFFTLMKIMRDNQKRKLKAIEFEQEIFRNQQELLQLKATVNGEQHERSRLAKELHDGIGGMLSAITLNLGAAFKKNTQESFTQIEKMLRDLAQEVRNTAHNLMPNALLQKSFAETLLQFRNGVNADRNLLHLEIYGDLEWIKNDAKLSLYRIIQELVQNTLKHAQATDMYLQIIEHPDTLQITFEDNGIGFDTSTIQKGQGIQNIESRTIALKGELDLQSTEKKGTTVFLEFPKERLR